jgi:hypothetical protein
MTRMINGEIVHMLKDEYFPLFAAVDLFYKVAKTFGQRHILAYDWRNGMVIEWERGMNDPHMISDGGQAWSLNHSAMWMEYGPGDTHAFIWRPHDSFDWHDCWGSLLIMTRQETGHLSEPRRLQQLLDMPPGHADWVPPRGVVRWTCPHFIDADRILTQYKTESEDECVVVVNLRLCQVVRKLGRANFVSLALGYVITCHSNEIQADPIDDPAPRPLLAQYWRYA